MDKVTNFWLAFLTSLYRNQLDRLNDIYDPENHSPGLAMVLPIYSENWMNDLTFYAKYVSELERLFK